MYVHCQSCYKYYIDNTEGSDYRPDMGGSVDSGSWSLCQLPPTHWNSESVSD